MYVEDDLLFSSETRNLSEVENCLKNGVNINIQSSEGESALQIAAANGHDDIVSYLLEMEASVDLANNDGWTPLMHAARYGHATTVDLLLKRKAKVNCTNKFGLSPLVMAAWSGNLPTIKLLIEKGAMINFPESIPCDWSCVMAAAFQGHGDVLHYLHEQGALLHHESHITGLTPLMLAAFNGHLACVQMLVEKNGNVSSIDACNRAASDLAAMCGHMFIKDFLEKSEVLKTDIFSAITNNDADRVKMIICENPKSLSAIDSCGATPLIKAAKMGHQSIALCLLLAGVDINFVDKDNGWTALMFAVFHRHVHIVKLLLEKRAEVEICDRNGYNALDLAQNINSSEGKVMEKLITKFASEHLQCKTAALHVSEKFKFSSSERFAGSQSQSRLKDWIGNVAQSLQTKMLKNRLSPSASANIPNMETESLNDSVNEVFMGPSSPSATFHADEDSPPYDCPDTYLAKELKQHKVESINPPFPSFSKGYPDFIHKKLPTNKLKKTHRVSLITPRLVMSAKRDAEMINRLLELSGEKNTYNYVEIVKQENEHVPDSSCLEKPPVLLQSPSCEELIENDSEAGELTTLLIKESLQKYTKAFKDQEIDVEAFKYLTQVDLKEIGIINSVSQEKLLDIINSLKDSK